LNKKLISLGAAGLGLSAIVGGLAVAADHRDSTSLAMPANAAADINDVYAWMTPDSTKVNLAMTVSPFATAGATFSPNTQYVLHVHSGAAFPATTAEQTIVCEFASATSAQCWAGASDYVSGDPSGAAGMTSANGRLKVFAGLRSDPFFFNLNGFQTAVATVKGAAASLTFDTAGCPALDAATSSVLVGQLQGEPGGGAAVDDFDGANTLAIVVQVDKAVVTTGGPTLAVWASTHTKP